MFNLTVEGGNIFISETGVLERCDAEETKKTFKTFEKYLILILSKKDNEIIVDWQKIEEIVKVANYRQREAIRQYIYSVLLTLNILTKNLEESYSFSEPGMNPCWGMPGSDYSSWQIGTLYFKRKEDIIAYGKARWAGALYNWNIFRMIESIQKQEIFK